VATDVVTVQDKKGKLTRQRSVPIDLFLLEALQEAGDFGDVVAGLSRGAASLLGLGGNTTISDALARAGNVDKSTVHLKLGLPVVPIPVLGKQVEEALIREADINLLSGNVEVLQENVDQLFGGPELLDFLKTKAQQRIEDRVRGNLEILRIEQQEEF